MDFRGTRVAAGKPAINLLWQLTRNLSYKREVVMEVVQIGVCVCILEAESVRLAGGLDVDWMWWSEGENN